MMHVMEIKHSPGIFYYSASMVISPLAIDYFAGIY